MRSIVDSNKLCRCLFIRILAYRIKNIISLTTNSIKQGSTYQHHVKNHFVQPPMRALNSYRLKAIRPYYSLLNSHCASCYTFVNVHWVDQNPNIEWTSATNCSKSRFFDLNRLCHLSTSLTKTTCEMCKLKTA